jgi:hypothetical protein
MPNSGERPGLYRSFSESIHTVNDSALNAFSAQHRPASHFHVKHQKGMKFEDRNLALCRAFVGAAKDILSHHPEVKHTWSIDDDEDHCILDIPKQSEDGFDITVKVFPHEIVVSADGPQENPSENPPPLRARDG